ncbi:fibronectin type III domain-containing protein [Pinibacter aurantiacus]|uniref:Fibronectin type-III domain-containing protein n=1 Tax=Pinibacter aurantiacus TaxID=2851599 RepID=A0A9E2S6U8_9BACT|nr:hypothetical protein [Pinibacter aurantiacus]MBV4357201.1 hypothetical protein [Pinibacter aurantiacus]
MKRKIINYVKNVCIVLSVLFAPLMLLAQTKEKKTQPAIRMIGRADSAGKKIYLRWAATDPQVWKINNQYGYTLERFTVLRDRNMLSVPERKLITVKPLKPQPLTAWETLAIKDSNAAVIAQALYGKDFEVSISEKGAAKIMAQSQELQQRFSFALYAADNSFDGALMAGWGYVDTDVKANEKYLYRLKTAAPQGVLKTDSTGVFISPAEYEPLPAVQEIVAQFGNHGALLSWDMHMLSRYYASYYVERSDDGGARFNRINRSPVSNFDDKDGQPTRMYFVDSLPENGKEYQYRVMGLNPFGQTGPASQIIKGKGKEMLAAVPNIRNAYVDEKGALQVNWVFDEKANDLIKGFVLQRADKATGPYKAFSDTLANSLRHAGIKKELSSSNYFTITAIAKEGEASTSFPYLVQPIDSTPPAIPTGVKAVIDTNGVVTLTWNKNTENDLMGYKVFRAQKKDEEPVPLIDSFWVRNSFKDTLSLKLLNKKVYYAVSALDERFNQSQKSALVEVKKPSVIPPSPAVLTKFKVEGNSVTLRWINSTDEDIAAHILYRKMDGDTAFELVQTFEGRSVDSFADAGLKASQKYHYYLQAKNEDGLTTNSEELIITTTSNASSKDMQITKLYAFPEADKRRIEVSWDDKIENVVEYNVYKAINGKQLTLFKVIPTAQKGLYDTDVQANTEYQYAVMAVLRSGAFSGMKAVTVKY